MCADTGASTGWRRLGLGRMRFGWPFFDAQLGAITCDSADWPPHLRPPLGRHHHHGTPSSAPTPFVLVA